MIKSKAIQYTLIVADAQMAKHVNELQEYATFAWRSSTGSADPGYSATTAEAFDNASRLIAAGDTNAFSNTRWFLFMPMRVPVTVMLSIETLDTGQTVWHLSMSRPNAVKQTVERVPDMLVKRVLKAFFGEAAVTEGPPEGPLKKVRHFRSTYQPN